MFYLISKRERVLEAISKQLVWKFHPKKQNLKEKLYQYRFFKLKYVESEENILEGKLGAYNYKISDLTIIDGMKTEVEYKVTAMIVTIEDKFPFQIYGNLREFNLGKELEQFTMKHPELRIENSERNIILHTQNTIFPAAEILELIIFAKELIKTMLEQGKEIVLKQTKQ